MYGILMESIVIFKLYTGLRYLALLFLIALIYLLITEKEKRIRTIFVYTPITILLLFFCPLFRKFFVAAGLDGETYYRILWLIPMGITTAYAGCKIWSNHRRIGLVVISAAVILCGTYVYNNPYITKAENPYHIPNTVIKICDLIGPEGEVPITAAVPSDLVHFIRQYDTNIKMPYGRDMLVARWDYYNEVYEVMEKPDMTETVNTQELLKATRNNYCNYVILMESRKLTENPTKYDLELLATIDGYQIYKDPIVYAMIDELNRQNAQSEEAQK